MACLQTEGTHWTLLLRHIVDEQERGVDVRSLISKVPMEMQSDHVRSFIVLRRGPAFQELLGRLGMQPSADAVADGAPADGAPAAEEPPRATPAAPDQTEWSDVF